MTDLAWLAIAATGAVLISGTTLTVLPHVRAAGSRRTVLVTARRRVSEADRSGESA